MEISMESLWAPRTALEEDKHLEKGEISTRRLDFPLEDRRLRAFKTKLIS